MSDLCNDKHTEVVKPWGSGWDNWHCTMQRGHGGKVHRHLRSGKSWPRFNKQGRLSGW